VVSEAPAVQAALEVMVDAAQMESSFVVSSLFLLAPGALVARGVTGA
jgi:hypothetical protein